MNPDNTEIPFRYELYTGVDPDTAEGRFLNNLVMTDTTILIVTSKNLNWNIKDVILLGQERSRYQVSNVKKIKATLSKNFYVNKTTFKYLLTISA